MGVGGVGIWQLLIILAIVLVLFGAKRLRNVGGDLGSAIKGFKKAMKEESKDEGSAQIGEAADNTADNRVIDAEVVEKKTDKS